MDRKYTATCELVPRTVLTTDTLRLEQVSDNRQVFGQQMTALFNSDSRTHED